MRSNRNPTPNPLPEGEGEFGYQTTNPQTWRKLQERAVEMRKNPTVTEALLWKILKNNALGYHFRRQQIIGPFIADFVCLRQKLIIEVDGKIHDYQKEADRERGQHLENLGFKIIRFKNEQVIHNLDSVKSRLLEALPFGEGRGGVR
jgi:leucyl-tRNA synthetase